ncbi:MAG: hypothetical protein QNI99_16665 [Woeseiaceae bacterium]|nr:hypothetical protein [Woeseiaceae bacterium]
MRVLAIFVAAMGMLLLSGCGTFQSMEELERQAMLTGDWSAVEQRERILAQREERRGLQCPSGHVSYCERYVGRQECRCISNDAMRDVLAAF